MTRLVAHRRIFPSRLARNPPILRRSRSAGPIPSSVHPSLKFEHFALNVPDPVRMAQWYVANLGFQVLRGCDTGSRTHFLADETGRVCLEIYRNQAAPVPDYASQDPLVFHFAVFAADAKELRARLVQAGARLQTEDTLPDGSGIVMLRDPWGVALQICQRAQPFPGF